MPSNPDPSNSGKFSRPIDAPSLPPWSRAAEERTPTAAPLVPAPLPQDADETPTLSGDAFPRPDDEPAPAVVVEDPRELAKRLAFEAKAKALAMRPQEEPMRTDDPRELARRLAEEAKRRLNPSAVPAPAPTPEEPITAWDQPAVQDTAYDPVHEPSMPVFTNEVLPADDADTDTPYDSDPDPDPPQDLPTTFARGRSLAERAAPAAVAKPKMSAMEALAAARLAEVQQQSRAPRHAAAPAPAPISAPAPEPPRAAAAAPRPTAPIGDPAVVFAELLPGASVEPPIVVQQMDVFRALWRAHRARALHDRAFELAATASVLIDAADRGVIVAAARVTHDGVGMAAWVDVQRKVLLGVARPAEVFLAGL